MEYKFRFCFEFAHKGTFTGDSEAIEFYANNENDQLKLSAVDGEKKFCSSSIFSLSGGPYKSKGEALIAAEHAKLSIIKYSINQRVGIDIGNNKLPGGLTNEGKNMLTQQHDMPVLDDVLGITIFEAIPQPLFVRFQMNGVVKKSTETFVENIISSFKQYLFISKKAELASELFVMSHLESTTRARFLALFMSLEALFDPIKRVESTRAHVDKLISITKNSELEQSDKDSMQGALSWLKSESIAQTGKRIAAEYLEGNKYYSLDPVPFFRKIYELRNSLIHRGATNIAELHSIIGDLERFVSDVLERQFVKP